MANPPPVAPRCRRRSQVPTTCAPRNGEVHTRGGPDLDTLLSRILITLGSAASIGFGIWHFSVPMLWNWYSYIDASATELVVAIRAINVFFSLSLVLFGLMNLLLAYGPDRSRYAAIVVLGATCILWSARVVMQIAYPQGSLNAVLQYGMLLSFALVLACHAIPLLLLILDRSRA